MSAVIKVGQPSGLVSFRCPGCHDFHQAPTSKEAKVRWDWNGSVEHPTLSPSLLVRSGHYVDGDTSNCWCVYNKQHPEDPVKHGCYRCHSFVENGNIRFLTDCTHELAGQTVPLPPVEP